MPRAEQPLGAPPSPGSPQESAASRAARRQDAVLVRLAELGAAPDLPLERLLRHATEAAGEAVAVARTSVWIFTDDGRRLRCLDLYDRDAAAHSAGAELEATRYPAYFAALREGRFVDAADAAADPRTREFAETYLAPRRIGAMLDAPVRLEGNVVGVVCFEHVGGVRPWRDHERAFAASIGDFVAIALEAERLRQTQGQLRRSEERFRSLFECAPLGMLLLDEAGRIRLVNPVASRILGASPWDLRDVSFPGRVSPDDRADVESALGQVHRRETECIGLDLRLTGEEPVEVRLTASPADRQAEESSLAIAVLENVTALRRAEREARQARQRETIGRLAAGIAHDFSNVLTSVRVTTQLLLEASPDVPELREMLADLDRDTGRATALVRQLLAIGREEPLQPAALDLAPALAEMEPMLRRLAGDACRIELQLAATIPPAWVDADGLQRIVANLVANARDAMPDGGTITIATMPGAVPDVVRLEVRDEGHGIDPALAGRIFEPFFTTRPPEGGSGLGLAIVQAIVEEGGGRVSAYSRPEGGSTFAVEFPSAASRQE